MRTWINPQYLAAEQLRASYHQATPFPHIMLKDFLLPEKTEELAQALGQQEFTPKQADLFSFNQTPDLLTVDDPVIMAFLTMLQSPAFHAWMEQITGIHTTSVDAMGALYKDCDYLLCHDDELDDRKIAYICNLGRDFTEASGGALALLDHDAQGRPRTVVKRIVPLFNSFTFFTVSSTSHHMVEEVLEDKERLSFGGWLHE